MQTRKLQYAEAEKTARKALALHLGSHPNSLETGWGYIALGGALKHQGRFTEALAAERKALAMMRTALQPEHASIGYATNPIIQTLAMADEAHKLDELFPTLAEIAELDSVFREILVTTKPTTLRWDDPSFIAAQAATQIVKCYIGLSGAWTRTQKTKEAEQANQQAKLLAEFLGERLAIMSQTDPRNAALSEMRAEVAELTERIDSETPSKTSANGTRAKDEILTPNKPTPVTPPTTKP